jgi:HAD superfamily hydrolase (TIGR01509 family)
VFGLGNRKNVDFTNELTENGTAAYAGSAAFVAASIQAGVAVAVVSSSENAKPVLAAAGILQLFPVIVDAKVARSLSLAGKPAPDTYVYAAEQLGLTPAECAVFEDATSGVQAGADGAFGLVIGVDRGAGADLLRRYGADVVVDDLAELIPQLPPTGH